MLDQHTRVLLRNTDAFNPLPPERAEQAWGGPVPGQICFTAQAQESAIFISEDWVTTIRSRRLIDCVGRMCAMTNALRDEFGVPITVELPASHYGSGTGLYRQLGRERVFRRCRIVGLWLFTIAVSGLAGALIQWILRLGS